MIAPPTLVSASHHTSRRHFPRHYPSHPPLHQLRPCICTSSTPTTPPKPHPRFSYLHSRTSEQTLTHIFLPPSPPCTPSTRQDHGSTMQQPRCLQKLLSYLREPHNTSTSAPGLLRTPFRRPRPAFRASHPILRNTIPQAAVAQSSSFRLPFRLPLPLRSPQAIVWAPLAQWSTLRRSHSFPLLPSRHPTSTPTSRHVPHLLFHDYSPCPHPGPPDLRLNELLHIQRERKREKESWLQAELK